MKIQEQLDGVRAITGGPPDARYFTDDVVKVMSSNYADLVGKEVIVTSQKENGIIITVLERGGERWKFYAHEVHLVRRSFGNSIRALFSRRTKNPAVR
ncbi:MAG TPA: hypothetical protein PLB89_18190, partial [Flavobacteriales bacterium]|nr:hypothetical protein [Flavobacteriales bacterium]